MKLYCLGCNGWIPSQNETSCFLIEHKNKLIMLDLGTGVSNLINYKTILDRYDELIVILSHYHLDHTIGLIYLLPYTKNKKVVIYGPGKPYYLKTTEEYLSELLRTEFFSRPLAMIAREVVCLDYSIKGFEIDDIRISVKEQIHSSPSFQIGIDDCLIYSTDTVFDESLFSNIYPNTILLHECWEVTNSSNNKHSSLPSLIKGLENKQFSKIVLIHQNPEWTLSDINMINKQIKNTIFCLGNDGMTINVP